MIITPAEPEDVQLIMDMREEASSWLRDRGVEQWREPWPTHDAMADRIIGSIAAGETWMVRDRDHTAATVALDSFADPRLWTPDECAEPARYLHRLIVRREYQGLGRRILDWASARAAHAGANWVRIDVWTHNKPLHRYYLDARFTHVRTLDLNDYPSGALFQRPARAEDFPGLPSNGVTVIGPVPTF
jgi:GNAT superfamily N-acetyltransferase